MEKTRVYEIGKISEDGDLPMPFEATSPVMLGSLLRRTGWNMIALPFQAAPAGQCPISVIG